MSREHDRAGRDRAASLRPGRQPAPGAADRGDAASVTAQLRTYGHVIPGQDQEAADGLAQMLRDMQCTHSAHPAIAGLDANRYADSQEPPVSNTNLAERVGFEPTIGLPL